MAGQIEEPHLDHRMMMKMLPFSVKKNINQLKLNLKRQTKHTRPDEPDEAVRTIRPPWPTNQSHQKIQPD
jgi:hypothetical protein